MDSNLRSPAKLFQNIFSASPFDLFHFAHYITKQKLACEYDEQGSRSLFLLALPTTTENLFFFLFPFSFFSSFFFLLLLSHYISSSLTPLSKHIKKKSNKSSSGRFPERSSGCTGHRSCKYAFITYISSVCVITSAQLMN